MANKPKKSKRVIVEHPNTDILGRLNKLEQCVSALAHRQRFGAPWDKPKDPKFSPGPLKLDSDLQPPGPLKLDITRAVHIQIGQHFRLRELGEDSDVMRRIDPRGLLEELEEVFVVDDQCRLRSVNKYTPVTPVFRRSLDGDTYEEG